jgi:hypothetical protein
MRIPRFLSQRVNGNAWDFALGKLHGVDHSIDGGHLFLLIRKPGEYVGMLAGLNFSAW